MKPDAPARKRAPEAHGSDALHEAFDAALTAEEAVLRELFPVPPARAPSPPRRLRTGRSVGLGLALVAAALGVAGLDPAWRTEQHATRVGERAEVALADGSRLGLDTATAVEVTWHLRSRRVLLRQGQARFDVAPSTLRPFEVAAAGTRIRVVGTSFDVRRRAADVRVTVLHGRVEVRRDGAPADTAVVLGPGQRLQVEGGVAGAPFEVDLASAAAWRDGRLVFDRTPLREALAELQRHRPAALRLHDDGRIGALAISGVFAADQSDPLLGLLPRIAPVRVLRQADGSVDIQPR